MPKITKFLGFNATFEKDFREEVVRQALTHAHKASIPVRRRLEDVVEKCCGKVGRSKRPPKPELVDQVLELTEERDEILEAVIPVWIDAQSALAEHVRSFLEAAGTALVEFADNQDRFVGRWQDTEMWRLADTFRAQYSEHNRNDAALMLSALTGRLPWPDDGGVNMKPSPDLNSLSSLTRVRSISRKPSPPSIIPEADAEQTGLSATAARSSSSVS